MLTKKLIEHERTQKIARIIAGFLIASAFLVTILSYSLLGSKTLLLKSTDTYLEPPLSELEVRPFPISIDIHNKSIITNPETETYLSSYSRNQNTQAERWLDQIQKHISSLPWYQNLATPTSRIIIIYPGDRKEQVAERIARILRWSDQDTTTFLHLVTERISGVPEGMLFPERYLVPVTAEPEYVATIITERFERKVLNRYTADIDTQIPLIDTLTFASMLDRETSNYEEMRIISGIMWNRIFIDMPLQIDATLQYVRQKSEHTDSWWPAPRPQDKFTESPFNTYLQLGIPPTPIANPGITSILAALNPLPTDCLFYLHDRAGRFYCSETYEDHLQLINIHY